VTLPRAGVQHLGVVLAADCLGVTSRFLAPQSTCVDGDRMHAGFSDGIQPLDALPPSPSPRPGTWPVAHEVACRGTPPDGAVCIPGGFSLLGMPALDSGGTDLSLELVPLRPVQLSPFFIDKTEFTVGRLRALLNAGASVNPMPAKQGDPSPPGSADCKFVSASNGGNDNMPLNCVRFETAQQLCHLSGGELTTEAQWEHAARGRGQGRAYPWGADEPTCCTASLGRSAALETGVSLATCSGEGPQTVGSHPVTASCPIGDVSRDGVLDLGGSLEELQLDTNHSYSDLCWQHEGVPLDPVCHDDLIPTHIERGADFSAGLEVALSALRRYASTDGGNTLGFRCAYLDVSP
jgi:formylglycine-generating enzyme required for sulfatase activity